MNIHEIYKLKNMGYCVYHTQKGKGSGAGLGNHIDRTESEKSKGFSYKTADPSMKEMNVKFKLSNDYQNMSIPDAVEHRIENGKTKGKAVRKDAVKYISHILSGSHEDMKEIFKDKSKAEDWVRENFKFVAREFGKENIIRFDLHLDEKTPHIHCVTVPITPDGRLSAKEVIGDRIVLQQRQNSYAEAMQQFGLERGLRDTGVRHEDVKEYYKRVEQSQEMANEMVLDGILSAEQSFELKNLAINSEYSEFSPMFLDSNQVVFASAKDSSFFNTRRYKWNDQPYLDLYVAKINEESQDLKDAIKFSKNINTKYHEASVTFSPDNSTMYFTRNNYGKKLKRDKNGVNHLKIYVSRKVDGEWTDAEEVPFNSDDYSSFLLHYNMHTFVLSNSLFKGFLFILIL